MKEGSDDGKSWLGENEIEKTNVRRMCVRQGKLPELEFGVIRSRTGRLSQNYLRGEGLRSDRLYCGYWRGDLRNVR